MNVAHEEVVKIIDKYFWDNVNHKYTCDEGFLADMEKLMRRPDDWVGYYCDDKKRDNVKHAVSDGGEQ